MDPEFSQELVERYQEYFRTRYSTEFSDEESQEGLASLAGLYEAFENLTEASF
jgi:hypothetical protein